jgi:hypothetical protein
MYEAGQLLQVAQMTKASDDKFWMASFPPLQHSSAATFQGFNGTLLACVLVIDGYVNKNAVSNCNLRKGHHECKQMCGKRGHSLPFSE